MKRGPFQSYTIRRAIPSDLFGELASRVLEIPPRERGHTGWWPCEPGLSDHPQVRSLGEKVAAALIGYVELATEALGYRDESGVKAWPALVGAEWWVRAARSDDPHHWHIDKDEGAWNRPQGERALYMPVWASVLYIGEQGGPTILTDQAPVMSDDGQDVLRFDPDDERAQNIAEHPEPNKFLIFPGWSRHGVAPEGTGIRHTILFNWWDRRPALAPAEATLLPGETCDR